MSTPRPFHHGNLPTALADAALAAVERDGHEVLSLRDLAAAVGVSRAAPYRHFADRRALLSAVAARGFEALDATVGNAAASAMTPRGRLRAGARAFLDFADARPHLFALLFASDLLTGANGVPPDLAAPARESYARIERDVAAAYPELNDAAVKARTLSMSATLRGYAAMRREGRIKAFMRGSMSEIDLEEAILTSATGIEPGEA